MLCFFSRINGFVNFHSANAIVNEYRDGYFVIAGILCIFVGAVLFFCLLRTFGIGKVWLIFILTGVLAVPCLAYSHFEGTQLVTISMAEFVVGPEVSGFDGEGSISRDAYLDTNKIAQAVNRMDDEAGAKQLEYLLEDAVVNEYTYENYNEFEPRANGKLQNGDEVVVIIEVNESKAREFDIAFSDTVITYKVEGLKKKPAMVGADELEKLKEAAKDITESEKGVHVTSAEITNTYDNGSIDIKVCDDEGKRVEWYTINLDDMTWTDFSREPVKFEDYY